jgi:hypothetical protein
MTDYCRDSNGESRVADAAPPGESVRIYWYPDTPIGFHDVKADSFDDAVDQLPSPKP